MTQKLEVKIDHGWPKLVQAWCNAA